jgi:hypothetical protein
MSVCVHGRAVADRLAQLRADRRRFPVESARMQTMMSSMYNDYPAQPAKRIPRGQQRHYATQFLHSKRRLRRQHRA